MLFAQFWTDLHKRGVETRRIVFNERIILGNGKGLFVIAIEDFSTEEPIDVPAENLLSQTDEKAGGTGPTCSYEVHNH